MKGIKENSKRRKLIFSLAILSVIIFTSVIISNKSMAKSSNNLNLSGIRIMTNKSKAFEEWEKLPDDERKLEFQPQYTDLSIKDSMKRSTYNTLLRSSNTLESKYNIDKSKITVKDQQSVGSCWAFAMTSMLETNYAKRYNKAPILYSPMHMEYKTYDMFTRELGFGGNYSLGISYMADGYGPVYEKDLPVESVYNEETNSEENYYLTDPSNVNTDIIKAKARLKDSVTFPSISKYYSDDSVTYINGTTAYTDEEVSAIRQKVKEHIKNYGAVVALFYCDMGLVSPDTNEVESKNGFYNNDTNAYYCNDNSVAVDHALTIIGWDDNFSRENFGVGENPKRPVNDGAYIVLNSWGSQYHDNGYFYVSYDDATIETGIQGIKEIDDFTEEPEAKESYDYIYKYDELGYDVGLSWGDDATMQAYTTLYGANVFPRQNNDENEYVTEVGVYLPTTEGIEIYVNENGEDLSEGKLVATYTGSNAVEPGFHVFKLSSPIKITGDKFAVKVKFIQSEFAILPLECNLYKNGISKVSTMYDKVTSNPNESFISVDNNKWDDLYNNTEYIPYENSNICIKAFTKLEKNLKIDVTGVSLNKSELTMEVGDETNLEATISPDNASNKTVIWESSDPDVASISDTGIITAKKEGTTTITVTTEDGNYSAECKVTVVAKKNTDDDIYKDDEGKTDDSENSETQIFDDGKIPEVIPKAGQDISEEKASAVSSNTILKCAIIVFAIGSVCLIVFYMKKNNNKK